MKVKALLLFIFILFLASAFKAPEGYEDYCTSNQDCSYESDFYCADSLDSADGLCCYFGECAYASGCHEQGSQITYETKEYECQDGEWVESDELDQPVEEDKEMDLSLSSTKVNETVTAEVTEKGTDYEVDEAIFELYFEEERYLNRRLKDETDDKGEVGFIVEVPGLYIITLEKSGYEDLTERFNFSSPTTTTTTTTTSLTTTTEETTTTTSSTTTTSTTTSSTTTTSTTTTSTTTTSTTTTTTLPERDVFRSFSDNVYSFSQKVMDTFRRNPSLWGLSVLVLLLLFYFYYTRRGTQ